MSNPNPKNPFAAAGIGHNPPHWKQPKLAPVQRDEIRQRLADGETAKGLALEYGISANYIRRMR